MALAWVLQGERVTSVLIWASKVSQIEENVAILDNLEISNGELAEIEGILIG
ncbi:aryl-alcohol dehydrogenase-like predicted oxidoreductase [Neobacillus niacini]|nr:aryl-alcohol dehydrogenase-like predicted oxidoreductase [Neobacillus niacini]